MLFQAQYYEKLRDGEFLTDCEREVLRWGKNAKNVSMPRRFTDSVHVYKMATALECLVRIILFQP